MNKGCQILLLNIVVGLITTVTVLFGLVFAYVGRDHPDERVAAALFFCGLGGICCIWLVIYVMDSNFVRDDLLVNKLNEISETLDTTKHNIEIYRNARKQLHKLDKEHLWRNMEEVSVLTNLITNVSINELDTML